MSERRAVCLSCIDGRIQLPVIHWIKENHNMDFVDMITEPGMDGLFVGENDYLEYVFRKTALSIERNNALVVFVVAHHDCRGNPAGESTHKEEIVTAVDSLKKRFSQLPIVGLWVNDQWAVELLLTK